MLLLEGKIYRKMSGGARRWDWRVTPEFGAKGERDMEDDWYPEIQDHTF